MDTILKLGRMGARNIVSTPSVRESIRNSLATLVSDPGPNVLTWSDSIRSMARGPIPVQGIWAPDPGWEAIVVHVEPDGERGMQFTIGGLSRASGISELTIKWGDGTSTITSATNCLANDDSWNSLTHTYKLPGDYMVQISPGMTFFRPHLMEVNGTNFSGYASWLPQGTLANTIVDGRTIGTWSIRNMLKVVRLLQWGESRTSFQRSYSGCFNMTGPLPEWPKTSSATSVYETFRYCYGLTGRIPKWPSWVKNTGYTYQYCSGLTGSIPDWPSGIIDLAYAYQNCTGLTGSVPEWPEGPKNLNDCYEFCFNLTGEIPPWPSSATSVQYAFRNCMKLTGSVPVWTSGITSAAYAFYSCSSLTGNIPEWGSGLTNVGNTYNGCPGLNGAWEGATEETLMPTRITSKGSCVSGCGPNLRSLFTSAWGGTAT